jgi:hypothetical protein
MTQIMNLLNFAPDIQEEILFLPPIESRPRPDPGTPTPAPHAGARLAQAAADVAGTACYGLKRDWNSPESA